MKADLSGSMPRSDNGGRGVWLALAERLSEPVLAAASGRRLRQTMPVEVAPGVDPATREAFSHFEAVARLLSGLGPWFESEIANDDERAVRDRLLAMAVEALRSGIDPDSPDRFLVGEDSAQPVVEAGYLSLALLRAPNALAGALEDSEARQLFDTLRQTRRLQPHTNNWLLFAAAVEAALCRFGEPDWDPMRIDFAVRMHTDWYHGDGVYGDGPRTRWDYYNSFVTHPFLVHISDVARDGVVRGVGSVRKATLDRARRFAAIQERLIAPDGTFPPVGRSLAYRCGAFHALAFAAYQGLLPDELTPAQVRCALAAVIERQMGHPGTFDRDGWLTIGFSGHQPSLGEAYISTGSLYLAANVLLPLGLPAEHPFWSAPDTEWTSRRLWSGQDSGPDVSLKD